jgi:hypothetical protein
VIETIQSLIGNISSNEYLEGNISATVISLKEDLTKELTEQNNLITTQEITIENIISALEDKCVGGGGITPKVEGNTLILSGANVEGGVLSL